MSGASLGTGQSALQAWLLHAAPGMLPRIAGRHDAERGQRLRIYANAYRWRLTQVLAEDYPALRAALGATAFERLAMQYLAAHPSRHPSVRWLGAALPGWLRAVGQAPARVALARFEWAQGEVFDAAGGTPGAAAMLARLSPEQWPRMRLRFNPALRLLEGIGNAPLRAAALLEGHRAPRWRRGERHWLVWRQDLDVHWRALPKDEATALAALMAGARFADACAVLGGTDDAALRAASLLKRWLADGLVSAVEAPDPAHPDSQLS